MKLVVFGLSVSSAWGNGHATQWRGLLRALARRGHEVLFFERDTPFYAAHRDMPAGDGYTIVVYPSFADVRERALRELEDADAAIVTSYHADAREAASLVLGSSALRVFYDLDTPITMDMLSRGEEVPWLPREGLGRFDVVLSFTGGSSLDALARLGARRVVPIYGCVDPNVHRLLAAAPRAEVSYLGTYAADRQSGVDALFLSVARARSSSQFMLGGSMYPTHIEWPANVEVIAHVVPAEHAAFYRSGRYTLNVTRAAMKRCGYCPSARLFEAAACGVPVVSDAWPGLEAFFEPDREIIVAETTAEVLRALAVDPADIARRARERAIEEHTADRRADDLLRALRRCAFGDSAPIDPDRPMRHDRT
jgi:spore maturation protein CgeB